MKKVTKVLLLVVLAAVFIAGGILVGFNLKTQKTAIIEDAMEQMTEVTKEISSSAIRASLDDIAELAVEEYNFTNVGTYEESNLKLFGIDIPFTEKSIILTYSGTTKAGIRDFETTKITINDTAKTVEVSLPAVEVLDTFIDANSIEIYDQTRHIFNPVDADDIPQLLAAEQEHARQLAVDNGILDKAEARLKGLIAAQLDPLLANTQCEAYRVKVTCLK